MSIKESEFSDYLRFAERLADAARRETLPRFRNGVDVFNKAGIWYDPVTDADREAERVQRKMIGAIFPDHGIIGEEFGEDGAERPKRWVLDPVDGTRAFVSGAASWATLIAFEFETRPLIGVIDQPYTDERWIGASGETFFRRGETKLPCRVSGATSLAKARVSTTDPLRSGYFTASEASAFDEIAGKARLCRYSLDAYAYGLLALGHLDLVIEAGLKRHDYAALEPIVAGAGGIVSDWTGEALGQDDRGRIVAAASADLHAAALELLANV